MKKKKWNQNIETVASLGLILFTASHQHLALAAAKNLTYCKSRLIWWDFRGGGGGYYFFPLKLLDHARDAAK